MKIAETIYMPFQKGHFSPVLAVSLNFQNCCLKKIAENSYITEKNHPAESWAILDFLQLQKDWLIYFLVF